MQKFNPADVFLIMGRRGSGKSFLGGVVQNAYPRKIIIDPMGEYDETKLGSSARIVETFEDFGRVLLEAKGGGNKVFTIVFRFSPETRDNQETFDEICRVCWYCGGVLVIIEEIQIFSTPHFLPHWLSQLLFTGRHQGVGLIFTTQRPGACHKSIISQANHIFCGSIHERNDIQYVASVVGRDEAMKLSQLPPRKFLYFQPGEGPPIFVKNSLD